jgi:hypothetical protein
LAGLVFHRGEPSRHCKPGIWARYSTRPEERKLA